jgi:hypothetical protein
LKTQQLLSLSVKQKDQTTFKHAQHQRKQTLICKWPEVGTGKPKASSTSLNKTVTQLWRAKNRIDLN